MLVAGFDPLRDEGLAYAETLREADNEVTLSFLRRLFHGFINVVGISSRAREALAEYCATVRAAQRPAAAAPS